MREDEVRTLQGPNKVLEEYLLFGGNLPHVSALELSEKYFVGTEFDSDLLVLWDRFCFFGAL